MTRGWLVDFRPALLKFVILSGMLGMATVSFAATVTYGPNTSTVPPVIPTGLLPTELVNVPITFPQWDPALFPGQTLTAVSFTLFGHAEGDIHLTNNNGPGVVASGTTSVSISLTDPNSVSVVTVIPSFSTGTQTFAAAETKDFLGLFGDASNSGAGTAPLSTYIGSGTYNALINTLSGFLVSGGGGNITSSQSTFASADGSVTYTFEPSETEVVPEPATILLGVTGLLGLSLLAARHRLAGK